MTAIFLPVNSNSVEQLRALLHQHCIKTLLK